MNLLDTSYLVDFERGEESARDFFDAHEHEAMAASTITLFKLAFAVVWDGERELETLQDSLTWVDFLDFSTGDAFEAARIQAELQEAGDRLPIGDVVIAGVARNRGATVVAGDSDFEDIDGISVHRHRKSD